MRKRSTDDVTRAIESQGGRWLSGEYKSNKSLLTILCSRGHTRKTSLGSVLAQNKCATCSYDDRKKWSTPQASSSHHTRKGKDKLRAMVNNLKVGPCVDCSATHEFFAMEFDHRPGVEKLMPVSAMVARHWRFEKIKEEVAKCDLVCVLCHRQRTHLRRLTIEPVVNKQQDRRRQGLAFIQSLKQKPCIDCGLCFKPWQMDFDHRPGESKVNHLSKMTAHSEATVLREVAKCDLVCVLCHRRRTHIRGEYGDGSKRVYKHLKKHRRNLHVEEE